MQSQAPAAATLVSVDGRTYPLESAHLLARAEGGVAMSTLVQAYANPHDEPLEVVYTMPLPADGAVTGYTIEVGERVIRGEVQPREKANAAYREALYEGKVAGLLEEQRPDTFEQRLGNVPPRTRVKVTIDVLHPVAFLTPAGARTAAGHEPAPTRPEWEYRFPTLVGVRYHGRPGRVPDRAALDPDRASRGEIPARMKLTVQVADEGGPEAASTSHRVATGSDGVVESVDGESLDRDVIVRWPAARPQVGVRVAEGGGLEGDDGRYALVTVVPPVAPAVTFRRAVTVLLDASGSMSGLPLDLAKVVVGDLLRSLEPGDRFELLAFSNDVQRLTPGLVKLEPVALANALRRLGETQAAGGTEMVQAVAEAMKGAGDDAQRQVVLVTDGQIGFETEVVAQVASKQNVRLHVVGVGHVPNRALTQQAAAAGRGLELLASSHAEANATARRLVTGTAHPVLTGVTVSGTALSGDLPEALRDVFAGQPLVFTVELSREGGTLDVQGSLAGSSDVWVHRTHVPPAGNGGAFPRTSLPIGALHGREAVSRWELLLAAGEMFFHGGRPHHDRAALESRIEQVAMRHRIVSRRTSLVAIAEEPSVDPLAPRRRERLAVELPAGVSAAGLGLGDEVSIDFSLHSADIPMMSPQYHMGALSEIPMRAMGGEVDRSMMDEAAGTDDRARALIAHEVRWVEPDLLLVEFECPPSGIVPPVDRASLVVHTMDGRTEKRRVEFVAERSTDATKASPGTLVRWVFRVAGDRSSLAGGVATLGWTANGQGGRGKRAKSSLELVLILPPAPSAGPAPRGPAVP